MATAERHWTPQRSGLAGNNQSSSFDAYIQVRMLKRISRSKRLYHWRITRIRASPAELISNVEAQHREQAIQAATREYGIINPQH
jgi:hypothetical protein